MENSIAVASRSGDPSSAFARVMAMTHMSDYNLAAIENHRDVAVLNQHFEDFKQGVEQDCNQLRPH